MHHGKTTPYLELKFELVFVQTQRKCKARTSRSRLDLPNILTIFYVEKIENEAKQNK